METENFQLAIITFPALNRSRRRFKLFPQERAATYLLFLLR